MRTESLTSLALAALLCAITTQAAAQVPDNRGVTLDPEDRVPPSYRDTLDAYDRQRLDAAREAGDTFMPVIQGPGEEDGTEASPEAPAAAPVPPRAVYEGYRRPEASRPRNEPGDRSAGDPGSESLRAEGPGPEGLVGVLIEAWTRPPEIVHLHYPQATARGPGSTSPGDEATLPVAPELRAAELIMPRIAAGRGLYARTLYSVNSDYPGPVFLELLEPPFVGAVVSGTFARVDERLALRLSRLEYRSRSVPVDAWAVGLDCACYGVRGEVDWHWFSRVLLPAAASFAEGFLAAFSRPEETVIVNGDILGPGVRYERRAAETGDAVNAGLATAARAAGDVLLESAPDGPTVRIPRDTELVVVFAAPPEEGAVANREMADE
ncbi:MAG: hypothetical protein OXO52_17340 [Rhodospirillales bacterium]|nr:hypothetical protein [Rhodospirillales bacterium]MDE0378498.1 hypothetical protein [Rhodospirillales bacterium]